MFRWYSRKSIKLVYFSASILAAFCNVGTSDVQISFNLKKNYFLDKIEKPKFMHLDSKIKVREKKQKMLKHTNNPKMKMKRWTFLNYFIVYLLPSEVFIRLECYDSESANFTWFYSKIWTFISYVVCLLAIFCSHLLSSISMILNSEDAIFNYSDLELLNSMLPFFYHFISCECFT